MSSVWTNRSYLKEIDHSAAELEYLLDLAAHLKAAKAGGYERPALTGANIALIFEKSSTRTRTAFEVAAHDQGAHATYLGPDGSQIGQKESIKDTARVLGRVFDGIEYRGAAHANVEVLAAHAGVPVWNGLTDTWHPTQTLADALTMREHLGRTGRPLRGATLAYCGDARFNMGNSLLVTGALLGMDVRVVAPRALWTAPSIVEQARGIATTTGAEVTVTDDVAQGVAGADFVYTDVWVSMGEPAEAWEQRIAVLRDYQVTMSLLERTGNPEVRFLHCLPAFHNRDTAVGEEVFQRTGMAELEVTDEVFESTHSIVFDQAANRMPTIKALMVATLT
ncbi:MAG: ornithine carbamoyltransferase [Actinomycetes bacterium]